MSASLRVKHPRLDNERVQVRGAAIEISRLGPQTGHPGIDGGDVASRRRGAARF